jgi:hypothetical protein
MNVVRLSKLAIAASLLGFSACDSELLDPVPEQFDALYIASSVRGNPVPYTIQYVDSYATLVSDSLQFFANGRGVQVTHLLQTDGSNNPPVPKRVQWTFDYQIDGHRLLLIPNPCNDASACVGVKGEINVRNAYFSTSALGSFDIAFSRLK